MSESQLVNFTVLLACFPFISLVPGMQAEGQPYCYLVAFVFIFLFRDRLPFRFYLFLLICAAYFIIFIGSSLYKGYGVELQALPHLLIYFGPPVFFWLVYRYFHLLRLKWIHTVFYVWVGVGLLQHFLPGVFAAIGLKSVLEALIPRFNVESLSAFGDRGVTSLSNEPSYAGIVLFSLFTVVMYRWVTAAISNRVFVLNLVLYLVSLVVNASLTMFLLSFLLLVAVVYQTRKYLLASIVVVLLVLPFILFEFKFRIIDLISFFPDMLEANEWNPYYVMIGPLGSHREFSSYVGLRSAFSHFLGNGYYSSMTEFIDVAKGMKVDLTRAYFFDYTNNGYYLNMKPYGFGALVLFELGVIPFLLINTILVALIRLARKTAGSYKRLGTVLAVGILVLLNFNTPASLPSYWFALAVSLYLISAGHPGTGNAAVIKNDETER